MVQPTVLKRRHSLRGKNMLPALRKLRGLQAQSIKGLARMTAGRRTEDMGLQDIGRHIQDLTGEEMEGLLEAAGKDMDDVLSARLLLHCLILLANETGQPTGQDLIEPEQQPGSSDKESEVPEVQGPAKKKQKIEDMVALVDRVSSLERAANSVEELRKKDSDMAINWLSIDGRIQELANRITDSKANKRQTRLYDNFTGFLSMIPGKVTLESCTPEDIIKYLIWKDKFGKTQVHSVNCKYLGKPDLADCLCPTRLSSGTVEGMMHQLSRIFEGQGFGRTWDPTGVNGNPAESLDVKKYLKLVQEEQAQAHVLPRQAKPIFMSKLRAMSLFIERELQRVDLSLRERYVLHRDQAYFKLQFFAGDRASDLSIVVTQEIKELSDRSGLVFQHTFGKTLRGSKGKCNTFVVKRCGDDAVCPVKALEALMDFSQSSNIDLRNGYVFRIVTEAGRVLDRPVNYSVVYERLRYYLVTLGLYDGETPHSFRSGCAVTLALSGSVREHEQMMGHMGWFTRESSEYYARLNKITDSAVVANRLALSTEKEDTIEQEFLSHGDYSQLKNAF